MEATLLNGIAVPIYRQTPLKHNGKLLEALIYKYTPNHLLHLTSQMNMDSYPIRYI
jgi:hypothetical protein